jgi:hypothetical protein
MRFGISPQQPFDRHIHLLHAFTRKRQIGWRCLLQLAKLDREERIFFF